MFSIWCPTSVEAFVQEVKEKYPHVNPKLIHDNGSQFISFEFVRLMQRLEIQQIRTRRNHPQTNGKIERMNGTTKSEAIRPQAPISYQEALEILNHWEYQYNYHRLHAGINYLRPADMFFGRGKQILNEREQKLEVARSNRKQKNRGGGNGYANRTLKARVESPTRKKRDKRDTRRLLDGIYIQISCKTRKYPTNILLRPARGNCGAQASLKNSI